MIIIINDLKKKNVSPSLLLLPRELNRVSKLKIFFSSPRLTTGRSGEYFKHRKIMRRYSKRNTTGNYT